MLNPDGTTLPFSHEEYDARHERTRASMAKAGIDALLISDPANMNWLTGYEGWSFYVPQFVLIKPDDSEPYWIGRAMDAPGARMTTYLHADHVLTYPEILVQRQDAHPMDHVAKLLSELDVGKARIGVESDTYYFTAKASQRLQRGLPTASFIDADRLVNWLRAVKSPMEIVYMRDAARLAEKAMQVAFERIEPGVRQCDLMGEILQAQVAGSPDYSGDLTGLFPNLLSGPAASTAHPVWSERVFEKEETTALELGGARHRYNCGLARTIQLGQAPQRLLDTAAAVEEGLEAALATMRPGTTGHEVHAAWQRVLDCHGLKKESRIGYSIGVGYPPDWGEHTISLRPHEATVLKPGQTFHVILGMWFEGWGMELSETVLITDTGCDTLTNFPRLVFVKN